MVPPLPEETGACGTTLGIGAAAFLGATVVIGAAVVFEATQSPDDSEGRPAEAELEEAEETLIPESDPDNEVETALIPPDPDEKTEAVAEPEPDPAFEPVIWLVSMILLAGKVPCRDMRILLLLN